MNSEEEDLKKKILDELLTKESSKEKYLKQYLAEVKDIIRLNEKSEVIILDAKITNEMKVALYLIGAAYAKAADLRNEDTVSNRELIENLMLKEGTVKSVLYSLRKRRWVTQVKPGYHSINYPAIADVIKVLKAK